MKAIEVKCLPFTNNKPYRLKAFCDAGSLTISTCQIDDELIKNNKPISEENRNIFIALQLARRLEWFPSEYYGKPVLGCIKNGNYVVVFTGRNDCNVIK